MPGDWIKASFFHSLRKKRDKDDCGNYKGITLLSILGKIIIESYCNTS